MRRAQRFGAYERIGYPVHYTAAKAGLGLDEARGVARRASLGAHRAVRRRKVIAAERDLSRARACAWARSANR